jgi:hypothetical protein
MSVKILKEKPSNAYSKDIQDMFHLVEFKYDNAIVMGTSSVGFNYPADYDLFEIVKSDVSLNALKSSVAKGFKQMFSDIRKNKNVYFIEFMCGVNNEGVPLKWSMKQVLKGVNGNYKLLDVLDEHSVIKIEIVVYESGKFIPISNVYEFKNHGKGVNQERTTKDDVDSLSKDIVKFHEQKNYMKILKRLFIISIKTKNEHLKNTLINIFQSDLGKLYMIKSNLDAMADVLDAGYRGKQLIERIHSEVQALKEECSRTSQNFNAKFYAKFDKLSKLKSATSLSSKLHALVEYLYDYVSKNTLKEMKKNKISYSKYLK